MAIRAERAVRAPSFAIWGLGIALAGGWTLAVSGITPWLLWVVALLALAAAFSTALPPPLAAAAGLALPVSIWVVLARVLEPLPFGIDVKSIAVLTAIAVPALVIAWLRHDRLPQMSRQGRLTLIALLPATLAIGGLVATIQFVGGRTVSWAMHNDAVWNTIATRLMVEDGGIDTASHSNPSPATSALMAAATSVGRLSVPSEQLLQHDLVRQSQFWLLAMLTTSLLAALIVVPRLKPLGNVGSTVAIALVSFLPLSWFVAGNAMEFGFINGTIALALLLACWLAWERLRDSSWGALLVLSASIVALLAAWAPLAIIPVALVVASLVDLGSRWWAELGVGGWIRLALVAAPVPAYAITITLPDLARESDALGGDGGIFPMRPEYLALAFVGAVLASVALGVRDRNWRDAAGAVAIVLSSTLAIGYLVFQRLDADFVWGYYLAKFSWLVMIMLLIVLAGTLATLISKVERLRLLLAAGAAALIIVVMALVPPTPKTAVPLAAVVGQGQLAASESTMQLLFSLSDVSQKKLVSAYLGPSDDGFINNWLIQIQTTDGADPIRAFAYALDGVDAIRVCEAAQVWGGDVWLYTRSPEVAAQLRACAAVSRVVVA